MIKTITSSTIFEIYVSTPPPVITETRYRRDAYNLTIIGFNADDTPFDFNVFDSFECQVKSTKEDSTPLYTFESSEIVLGKTDITQSEYDELNLSSALALDLSLEYTNVFLDVRAVIGNEKLTIVSNKIKIQTDVSR
jgi:hypothetical protein